MATDCARLYPLNCLGHLAPHFTSGHLSTVSWAADVLTYSGLLG